MHPRLAFRARQLFYDLESGLILRPGIITASLAATAIVLVNVDQARWTGRYLARFLPLVFTGEPSSAQTLLGTIAGSMMTVVSIVYSVLVMMLTLASMQFSPRVVAALLRDRQSQTTLGFFIGTFTYCLLVLRAVRVDPPFVPALSAGFAIVLALMALASLIYFIHHIAHNMQANFLVDHVARETEHVIDASFPERIEPGQPVVEASPIAMPADAAPVMSGASGYVQLVDVGALKNFARERGVSMYMHRGVGEFAIEGQPLVFVHPPGGVDGEARATVTGAYDIGPARTMQDDVEFGVRQIVDVALKAISPAINDPSTANTCIDHLGRLLCRLARRRIPSPVLELGDGRVLVVKQASFRGVLDLAFNQLRQYGRGDMAVCLRMVRTLAEIGAVAPSRADLVRIVEHARLIEAEVRKTFHALDCDELTFRLEALERIIAEQAAEVAQAEAVAQAAGVLPAGVVAQAEAVAKAEAGAGDTA